MKSVKSGANPAGISEKVIRLLEIYTLIAQKQFPSIDFLMERFHVSKRTVFRYLELINIIDPIEYDKERNGYAFTEGDRIKKLILTDEEFQALLAAGESVSHLGAIFKENFQKLVIRMFTHGGKMPVNKGKPAIIIKTQDAIFSAKIGSILEVLIPCIEEKRAVDINYNARLSKEVTKRTVDPYVVVLYDGIWILVGFCHLRKTIRSFALDRIIDIQERNLYFTSQPDFDLKAHLSSPWGIIDGKEARVTVRFKKEIADYILRKDMWHSSEKRTILPDGAVELSFTVAGVDEIKRWIYSWLPHVEVIKPVWFRKQIQKELSASVKDHLV
jgi:predicted DNA-binding transcriptional regulator YafY